MSESNFNDDERAECERLLRQGLDEDLGSAGDITSQAVIDPHRQTTAYIVVRQAGFVAGLPALDILGSMMPTVSLTSLQSDGPAERGMKIARVEGPTRDVLGIERAMLNLLCRLSGIATLTARYVSAIAGTNAVICDTRKTTPGWRYLEKYAVRVGGGLNHRIGLFDAVLIKDNHLADLARHEAHPVRVAVERARAAAPYAKFVEIEVDRLEQFDEALAARPDIILLDNMSLDEIREAVARRERQGCQDMKLEVSGGVTLETVRRFAETGVDRISVGAITHSAPILDLALDDADTIRDGTN